MILGKNTQLWPIILQGTKALDSKLCVPKKTTVIKEFFFFNRRATRWGDYREGLGESENRMVTQ